MYVVFIVFISGAIAGVYSNERAAEKSVSLEDIDNATIISYDVY